MERKLIAVAVSSALALPMAAQAVEVSPYGQINRAIISVDGTGDAPMATCSTRTPPPPVPVGGSPAARTSRTE